jgi:glycosyltransferase involved in cell wall biosynthesis
VSAGPAVTVVIPTFNVGRFVGECLASVCAQTLTDWECIVVDDGSTDDTRNRVLQHADPRIRLITQANHGVSAARNVGLANARGAHLLFLDGDDLLHPEALKRLSAALDTHSHAVVSYGTVWLIHEDGRAYPQVALHRRKQRFQSGHLLARMMCGENSLVIGAAMIRTRVARELDGFRTDLRLAEDWEFWCRVAAQGQFRFIGTDPEVSYARVRKGSASRLLSPRWENHLPTIHAVLSNPVLASRFGQAEWRRLSRQLIAFHLWEAGRINFIARRHAEARRLMLRSLATRVTAKRLGLFAIAQASALLGVSLVPPLRFLDNEAHP